MKARLSIAPSPPNMPSAILREEDFVGVTFYGTREALIAAGIAKDEWLPTGAIAYVRKDGVPVRKWVICTRTNGRYVWGSLDKQTGRYGLKIQRTAAEEAAWKVRREAEEKARRDRERGISAAERARLDAQHRAEETRLTAADWLEGFAYRSEAMVMWAIDKLSEGHVKRISEESRKRLVSLNRLLHDAMRKADVLSADAREPEVSPRVRLVVDNELQPQA